MLRNPDSRCHEPIQLSPRINDTIYDLVIKTYPEASHVACSLLAGGRPVDGVPNAQINNGFASAFA